MARKMLVDLRRCVGCWTCSMSCKMSNHLDDDVYRVTVRTNGSGAGIDRPAGEYPNLSMNWMPVYKKSCTFCPDRLKDNKEPFCVYNCPTKALSFGEENDPDSEFSKNVERCKNLHYHFFEIPSYEETRGNIVYATKE